MSDMLYYGDHSIDIITPDGHTYNTWEDFYLAPMARPFVAAPSVKTEYINVPGADGALDYTEVLTGRPRYTNRTGQWQFILDNGRFNWPDILSNLLNKFHGKAVKVILRDDPNFYYEGRISLSPGFGNKDFSSVVIAYNFDPYKYPVGTSKNQNWLWNELFGNTIYYGNFTVNGVKARNLINDSGNPQYVTVTVSYDMELIPYDGTEATQYSYLSKEMQDHVSSYEHKSLNTGDNLVELQPGDNYFFFIGNGLVTVEQERGKTL